MGTRKFLPTPHSPLPTPYSLMNIAIIPAAGAGSRFGGQIPKQFVEVAGAPIIVHTLRRFDECDEIGAMIVALRPEEIERFGQSLPAHKIRKPVRLVGGGAERSDSILNALEAAKEFDPELVAVHDAVRPFVTPERISATLRRDWMSRCRSLPRRERSPPSMTTAPGTGRPPPDRCHCLWARSSGIRPTSRRSAPGWC